MPRDPIGLNERFCPVCGKIFFPRGPWGYHGKNNRMVCSYPCSIEDTKEKPKSKKKPVSMFEYDGTLIQSFQSIHDAMLQTGIGQTTIRKCVIGIAKYTNFQGRRVFFQYQKTGE